MSDNKSNIYNYVVVGGGASGVFSAIQFCLALKSGPPKVLIAEGSRRLLTKVKISGGGRCNVTHHEFDPKKLVTNYPRGERELRGPFSRFQPEDTKNFFEERGVDLKVESDGRMFPVTDNSQTIIDCLLREAEKNSVEIKKGYLFESIEQKDGIFVLTDKKGEKVYSKKVLIATGSNPSVWAILSELGVDIVDPIPSLFTFTISHALLDDAAGTAFETVGLSLKIFGKDYLEEYKSETKESKKYQFAFKGPLLITHWGLSGPAVLKLSAFAARHLFKTGYRAELTCNFMNDKTPEVVLEELKKEQEKSPKLKVNKYSPFSGITRKFWGKLLSESGISEEHSWNEISLKSLRKISELLTRCSFHISGKGAFKEEFVTSGGVNLKELDLKTMELKKIPGLYVAGEATNVDGITGGFNFQNAWTGGYLAGCDAALKIDSELS